MGNSNREPGGFPVPDSRDEAEQDPGTLLPARWSDWKLTSLIGEGASASVYKAVRKDDAGTSFSAIKILRLSGEEKLREKIEEIKMMLSLKGYPRIVSIEDYATIHGEKDYTILIRMELLTPLIEFVGANGCDEAETIRIGIALCEALEHCAKKKILHLDIKPGNIFVTEDGYYKLGDFGISRSAETLSDDLPEDCSPRFMGPELYHLLMRRDYPDRSFPLAGREIDIRYDLCSVGLVLYWLRNNYIPPFEPGHTRSARDITDAFMRRMNGEPLPSPTDASPGLTEIILKACAFDPEDRYRDPTEMKSALEALLSGTSEPEAGSGGSSGAEDVPEAQQGNTLVSAEPPARIPIPEKEPKKLPGIHKFLAVLLILSLVFAVYLIAFPRKPRYDPEKIQSQFAAAGTDSAREIIRLIAADSVPEETIESGTCGENLHWVLSGTVLRITGSGEMDNYSSDSQPWARHRETITMVIVEEGAVSVGRYAFFRFENLADVRLPGSLRRIGNMAFGYCYSLPKLIVPEGTEHLEKSIVYRCYHLEEISLPGTVKLIEGSFAGECASLRKITLGEECTDYTVRDGVLFDAAMETLICHPAALSGLSYSIPESVRTIGVYAFAENASLTEVSIPEGVSVIDSCAFSGCKNLRKAVFPDSVASLGIYAFYDCESLKEVRLSSQIPLVDQQAFYQCSSLRKISLPDSVTRIGTAVFSRCANLQTVRIPPSVTSIDSSAFDESPSVKILGTGGSYAQQYADEHGIPFADLSGQASGEWSEWSETRREDIPSESVEEESRTVHRWWAAQCTACGANNPYHGRTAYCHNCGITLANDQGVWKSVFAYSETIGETQPLFGRENCMFFDRLPYWLEHKQVVQYRYRTVAEPAVSINE